MIKATLSDGREVTILFHHCMETDEFKLPENVANNAQAKGFTSARIVAGGKGTEDVLAYGEAYYSSTERVPYSREVGRQHAIKRAIMNPTFSDEDRGRLLKAYYNRPRPRVLAQSVQREEPTINTDY